MWAARADARSDPAEAAALWAAADTARAEAAQLTEQVDQLEEANAARTAWWLEPP